MRPTGKRKKIFSSLRLWSAVLGPALLIGTTISANEASAWTLTADFESGTLGQKAVGPSGFDGAGQRTTFSNERVHSGSKSARMEWSGPGDTGWDCCTGIFTFSTASASYVTQGQEIWARGYYYFKSPWSWKQNDSSQANIVKILRFGERFADGSNAGMDSIVYDTGDTVDGNTIFAGMEGDTLENGASRSGNLYPNRSGTTQLLPDRWIALELYVKFHNTDGVLRVWQDGKLVVEHSKINTARAVDSFYFQNLWMSFWNGGAPQQQVAYLDDIVVTTNRPADRDAQGNPMIGSQPVQTDATAPQPPTGLRIN